MSRPTYEACLFRASPGLDSEKRNIMMNFLEKHQALYIGGTQTTRLFVIFLSPPITPNAAPLSDQHRINNNRPALHKTLLDSDYIGAS